MSGNPIMASVDMFASNFVPSGWSMCAGQLIPISQNSALFSIIGTVYGGDGRTTFALPDMRGRIPIGAGHGTDLSARFLGQRGGQENIGLLSMNIPSHSHDFLLYNGEGDSNTGDNTSLAKEPVDATQTSGDSPLEIFKNATPSASMNSNTVSNTGGSQQFSNMQPFMSLIFAIAMEGIYPSRS